MHCALFIKRFHFRIAFCIFIVFFYLVIFKDAPVVTAVPSKVATLQGTSVALTCSVLSVPKSDVRWFFKRNQLKMDQKHMMEERQNNYTLTIENVNESNLGEYTCTAVNKIGDGQDVVFLSGKIKIPQCSVEIS